MNINITADELKLLTWFDEHATGYADFNLMGPRDFQPVLNELNLPEAQFRRQASFLCEFKLLRILMTNMSTFNQMSFNINAIGITGLGANYLRQLEAELEKAEPGKFKKLTVKSVDLLGKVGVAVAVKVLTDHATTLLNSLHAH